jgi:hypothetical protein
MSIASCGLADIELSAAKNFGASKGALGICEKEQPIRKNRPPGKNLGSADDIRGGQTSNLSTSCG